MLLLAIDFDNLHQILQNLYVEMMPLCSKMTGVARGLAGLGALFYVAYRVWQALVRAEPVVSVTAGASVPARMFVPVSRLVSSTVEASMTTDSSIASIRFFMTFPPVR